MLFLSSPFLVLNFVKPRLQHPRLSLFRTFSNFEPPSNTSNRFEHPCAPLKPRQHSRPCAKHPSRASPSLVVSPRVPPILVLRFEAGFELQSRRRTSKAAFEPRFLEQASRKFLSRLHYIVSTPSRLYSLSSTLLPLLRIPPRTSKFASSFESFFELRSSPSNLAPFPSSRTPLTRGGRFAEA